MSEKKKILVLHPSMVIGGAETILINYLNILAKNPNYEVHLLVFEGMEKYNVEKIDTAVKVDFLLNDIETQFHRYCYWSFQKENILENDRNYYISWRDYANKVRLDRLISKIEKEQYDVVIDFLLTTLQFISKEYLEKIQKKIIYWIHSNLDFDKWLFNKIEYKDKLECIDTFVSICQDMDVKSKHILRNEFGINKKHYTIYNPIDKNKIMELAKYPLDELDLKLINEPFILQVSRLDSGKNHLKMIELFSKLKQKGIKEKLYIIGDGESYSILQEKIKELDLENECLLLGSRTNPIPFMAKAKLFIHTSNYEGLPTVLIESMICGVPVVAFNCPTGPREILADGKYGELIPMGDDELFIEKTYELLTNEEKRQDYISLLPEAVERFSFEKIEKDFFALIEKTISE